MKNKIFHKQLPKFIFCILLVLSFAIPVSASSVDIGGSAMSKDDSSSTAVEVLTVGVPDDRCPIFYRDDKTGDIAGIGVDLMRSAAEEAGYSVTFCVIKEATLKEALDNESYDVILPFGSAIKSASGKQSVVSENLMQTPFTLVTEGNHYIPPMSELKVGMLSSLGGAAETVNQLYPGIDIKMYDTMPECVRALRRGEVDALLHNSYIWSYVLQKPSYHDLEVQPADMFSMDFRAGALDTPEGREIIERLNKGIASLTDTQRQAVILDYTSRRLYRYDIFDYLYQYGLFILLIAILFGLIIHFAVQKVSSVRREQAKKMQQLIEYDPLTGALSLKGFRKRVEEILTEHPDNPYLLAYVNIRNFKFINDSLGMDAGDELLKFWVKKTKESLSDEEAMCRLGADHFAVLRCSGGDEKLINDDKEVIDSVRTYFIDRGKENRVQVCGGLYVLTPEDYQNIDVDHMLDYARVAERKVREQKSDGYEFYNPEQWEKGKRVADVVNYLNTALQEGDIHVWYQPQVDAGTGNITGAEALCRWNHNKIKWILPNDFIPTLEESGLIYDLDCFVWDRVCRDLHKWNEQGIKRIVSVNVSRCDVSEERNIPKHFHDLIQKYDLTPDQLHIEITETAYAEKSDMLISTTEKLREYGFQVEMDDFGSGYSSLHMLKEVPVDRIKLDLRFLTDAGDHERGRVIIGYMIRMVQSLGMQIITEGVETAEQAEFLRSQGCNEMQGYYFYKPMPVEEFEKLS